MNPIGYEILRSHTETVLLCRAMPPLAGQFPQVSTDDWCGHYESSTAA
jgi:hypothetical protein